MAVVFGITPQCRAALQQIRATSSPQETATLFAALNAIAANPTLPGSFPTYYDPTDPSARAFRASPFLIHYRTNQQGIVEFTNVWKSPA